MGPRRRRLWFLAPFLIFVATAGTMCENPEPSGPDFNITNNSGSILINTTDGSSSPVGTAPCGASSTQKANPANPAAPNCSSTTDTK